MAQPTSVLDLGCGIGGDLVALARAGLTVAGVDRDELRVEVARANLAALSLELSDGERERIGTLGARRLRTGDPDFAPAWD